MADPVKNGFDAIGYVSQCFGDLQNYVNIMEKDMRELEAAYDDIQDENDKLRNENEKLREELKKLDPTECRRSFMNELEQMDAEKIKQIAIRTVFDIMMTGAEDENKDDE